MRHLFLKTLGQRMRLLFLASTLVILSGCLTNPNQPPQLLRGDTLEFPLEARAAGIEGVVQVRYDVRADGSVHNAKIVSAEPPDVFDEAALSAIARWRFRPGRKSGEPTNFSGMVSTLRFTFGETDDYPTR